MNAYQKHAINYLEALKRIPEYKRDRERSQQLLEEISGWIDNSDNVALLHNDPDNEEVKNFWDKLEELEELSRKWHITYVPLIDPDVGIERVKKDCAIVDPTIGFSFEILDRKDPRTPTQEVTWELRDDGNPVEANFLIHILSKKFKDPLPLPKNETKALLADRVEFLGLPKNVAEYCSVTKKISCNELIKWEYYDHYKKTGSIYSVVKKFFPGLDSANIADSKERQEVRRHINYAKKFIKAIQSSI